MKTNGFTCGYSNYLGAGTITTDVALPNGLCSTYITCSGTGGLIVYQNGNGEPQVAQIFVGRNPISATQLLASATVYGVEQTSSATQIGWEASTPVYP